MLEMRLDLCFMDLKTKWLTLGILVMSVVALAWVGSQHSGPPPDTAESSDWYEVRLRTIGHKILLAIGDDSSRVLPIERRSAQEYFIRFEHVFSFTPDSIVTIVRDHLEDSSFTRPYIFQVLECKTSDIVYSFNIVGEPGADLIPCDGRRVPLACYTMRIKFNPHTADLKWGIVLMSILILSFGIYWLKKKSRQGKTMPLDAVQETQIQSVGKYQFDLKNQLLYWEHEKTSLSAKESELLNLFIQAPNELLEREYLLKTVWEDQGVIVGRSLDVFVSKLRKKLAHDPDINLISVHGRGYKLEINS